MKKPRWDLSERGSSLRRFGARGAQGYGTPPHQGNAQFGGKVSSASPALTVLPKNGIEPSDCAGPVAHVGRSGALTFDKAVLSWAGRNLDGNHAEQQYDAVPNHKSD